MGFMVLQNVPGYDQAELLKAVMAFHSEIPLEDKEPLKPKHFNDANPQRLRGFFPFIPNDPSHKEFYDMAHRLEDLEPEELKKGILYEESPWLTNDVEGKHLWIKKTFDKYFKLMHNLTNELISLLALGLGKKASYFEPWFKNNSGSVFRAIHYLPRTHERAAASDDMPE